MSDAREPRGQEVAPPEKLRPQSVHKVAKRALRVDELLEDEVEPLFGLTRIAGRGAPRAANVQGHAAERLQQAVVQVAGESQSLFVRRSLAHHLHEVHLIE